MGCGGALQRKSGRTGRNADGSDSGSVFADALQGQPDSQIPADLENDVEDNPQRKSATGSSGMLREVENITSEAERGVDLAHRDILSNTIGFDIVDPTNYTDTLPCGQHLGWKNAMREEFASLNANDTWAYVPAGNKQAIRCRWVFKTKVNAHRSTRLKAPLVIKGYEQVEGTDYRDTYTPVAKLTSFHLLVALAARNC